MVNVMILGGKGGAGKGTLVGLSNAADTHLVISTGNLLRAAVAAGTELGLEAKSYMDRGLLVPDELIIGMVLESIKASAKPVILDGFPRSLDQSKAMLNAGIIPSVCIIVEAPDEELLMRAEKRVVCLKCGASYTTDDYNPTKVPGICDQCGGATGKRRDDQPEVVQKRLAEYHANTLPAYEYLRSSGIPIVIVNNSNARPKGEALAEFVSALDK